MGAGADILSDTMGVDFGPYMRRVIEATYRSWIPIIPESARPPLDKQGRVGVRFKIYPDGSVKEMILEFPSGDVSLDRAAWGGITGASPYPPLPKGLQRAIPGAALRLLLQPGPGQVSLRERASLVPADPEFRKRQIYGLLVVAVLLLLAGLGRSSLPTSFRRGGGEFGRGDGGAAAGRHSGPDRQRQNLSLRRARPALRR